MAAPTEINFKYTKGDTAAIVLNLTDSAGAVINISGFGFVMTVDPSEAPIDDTTKSMQITGTILDGPNGKVEFAPTQIQSDALTVREEFHDIQQVDGAARKKTIGKGSFEILPEITMTP